MGPLDGIRIIELAGLGPGPYGTMLLADLGADVLRIERPGDVFGLGRPEHELLARNRPSVTIDLKDPLGQAVMLDLVQEADALIEGYRPGVAERMGVGPDECLARNPRLCYARMTGWGQQGQLASEPGHDINYLAMTGVLDAIGPPDGPPSIPLNLIADFGGGGMLLAFGLTAALLHAGRMGEGQVVDVAMVDGAASMTTMMHGLAADGLWTWDRGANLLDGGCPFYAVYATSDAGYMAVGALEPQFFAELIDVLGVTFDVPSQYERSTWGHLRAVLASAFATKTRAEWIERFDGREACVTPVLNMEEAHGHFHHRDREMFVEIDGVVQPGPVPRFSATPASRPRPRAPASAQVLNEWGIPSDRIADLIEQSIVS
ncbi:MAG: CoA transferase [Acidimicrobiia bacterium]|nr:CoA transferase [Acidimicrobiia bacterium]NNL29159.1 CoA transferase [Acidimicrobiia bacterium]